MKQKRRKLYIWCSGTYRCYCYPRRYGKLSRCCCCYLIWRRWSCFLDVADRTHWLFQQFIESTLAQIYKEKDPLYGGYRGGPAYVMDRIRLVTKIKREDAFVKNVKEEAEYVADDEQTYYTRGCNTVS